jgi:GNAT superfamily N-acetyltransferase
MEYLIRKCEEKDLPELVVLCQKHAAYEQTGYDPEGKAAALQQALFSANPVLFCAVVECGQTLQGYYTYTFDFSTWDAQKFLYLDCLYLEPAYRGQGIGKVIFEQLKAIAARYQCVNIQWQTPDFNESAIRFYHRVGGVGKDKVRFFLKVP